MLYDGCIKNIKLARMAMESDNISKTHECLVKAQAIIGEFINTLNRDYDISTNLASLYEYILRLLIDANVKKKPELLEEPLEMLVELRDTWAEAVQLDRKQNYGAV
ncbi:flagellar export chaperone FliS, partial [Oscillospiraceae bacterium OttesenSCG-928-F05]|nr:flagellar export chaperone FliS [Oscillospiraceae bacterium OttesenSCG-928-F05]